jgi:hypothetical protein
VGASAALRTYRAGGLQSLVMLIVLAGCAAFAPVAVWFAVAARQPLVLAWSAIVAWLIGTTLWRAAYRIDVTAETIEFRTLLRRRRFPIRHVRWIRGSRSFAVIRLRHATLHVYGAVDNWSSLVESVYRANHRVRVFRVGSP